MTDDVWLIGAVAAVWAALALLYGLVPAFHMPGSVLVWGGGAVLFVGLAFAIAAADLRRGRPRR